MFQRLPSRMRRGIRRSSIAVSSRSSLDNGEWKGRTLFRRTPTRSSSELLFGDPEWTDYDFTVTAMRIGGGEIHSRCSSVPRISVARTSSRSPEATTLIPSSTFGIEDTRIGLNSTDSRFKTVDGTRHGFRFGATASRAPFMTLRSVRMFGCLILPMAAIPGDASDCKLSARLFVSRTSR